MAPPRIIAGKYKGMRLQPVPGTVTRPITDRVKEALFNVIGADIVDSVFLDLFGGTGSVGMEALSRGAAFAVFIEKDNTAFHVLAKNLSLTKNSEKYKLLRGDAFSYVDKGFEQAFDYVFIAPPQYKEMWEKMVQEVDQNPSILEKNAWVIAQIDPNEYKVIPLSNLREFDQRDYGSTRLVFYINP